MEKNKLSLRASDDQEFGNSLELSGSESVMPLSSDVPEARAAGG
jgi:hypothetical protein